MGSYFPCSHNFLWCMNEATGRWCLYLSCWYACFLSHVTLAVAISSDSLTVKPHFTSSFWAVFFKETLFAFQRYSFCWEDYNISIFSACFVSYHPFLRSETGTSLFLLFPCVSQDHREGVLDVIFLLGLISNQNNFLVFSSNYWKTIRNMDAHVSK